MAKSKIPRPVKELFWSLVCWGAFGIMVPLGIVWILLKL
jgi:hypothetical protein